MKFQVLGASTALLALVGVNLGLCADTAEPYEALFAYAGYRLDYMVTNGRPKIASGCPDGGGGSGTACSFDEFTKYAYESRGSYTEGSFDPDNGDFGELINYMGAKLYRAGWGGVRPDTDKLAGTKSFYKALDFIQDRIISARQADKGTAGDLLSFLAYDAMATNASQCAHLERIAINSVDNTPKLKNTLKDKLGRSNIPTEKRTSPLGLEYEVVDFGALVDIEVKKNGGDTPDGIAAVSILATVGAAWGASDKGQYGKIFGWAQRYSKLGRNCLFGAA